MNNTQMLENLAQRLENIFNKLELKVTLDLQEEASQLCVGEFIVSAEGEQGYMVVVPLDDDAKDVAVYSFPQEIHAARYLVGQFVG